MLAMPERSRQSPRKRVRLSPEERQAQILDCTADIIANEGVSALSMDRIGREAGVSKSLVYNYFPSITELLRQLLQREWRRLRRLQAAAAESARTFEELVRAVTHVYLKYIDERGLLIERLQAEPSVSEIRNPTEYSRDRAVDYLAGVIATHFDLPLDIARAATDISFGLPAAAGVYLQRRQMSLAALEDLTCTMILGTLNEIKREHSNSRQAIRKVRPDDQSRLT